MCHSCLTIGQHLKIWYKIIILTETVKLINVDYSLRNDHFTPGRPILTVCQSICFELNQIWFVPLAIERRKKTKLKFNTNCWNVHKSVKSVSRCRTV